MTMPRFLVGLDLGQSQDPTALTVIERIEIPSTALAPQFYYYDMRFLKRFPLQMSYPDVMKSVNEIITDPRLSGEIALLVDTTGVGAAVVDLLRLMHLPCKLIPVLVTFGTSITHDGKRWHVPKRNLATAVRILLESERLKIRTYLKDHILLLKELRAFRIKITKAKNDTYEAWRENDHDDLVFATAMCCWFGERKRPTTPAVPEPPPLPVITERKINDMSTEITYTPIPDVDRLRTQEGWTFNDLQQRGIRG